MSTIHKQSGMKGQKCRSAGWWQFVTRRVLRRQGLIWFGSNNNSFCTMKANVTWPSCSFNIYTSFTFVPCFRSRRSPYAFPTCRIVTKDGRYNVFTGRIPERNFRYFKDFGNTLISMQWRWILFGLCAANIGAYAIFAVMWTVIALLDDGSGVVPCIGGTNTTTGYMILSIETHTSIGSGTFWANECHGSWMLMTLHAVVGVAIEGALVTAIFVKISRPHKDNALMLFSKRAVVRYWS